MQEMNEMNRIHLNTIIGYVLTPAEKYSSFLVGICYHITNRFRFTYLYEFNFTILLQKSQACNKLFLTIPNLLYNLSNQNLI